MKNKVQLIAWVAFIVVIGGVILYALRGDHVEEGSQIATGNQEDPQQVEILKYSDYSCPACKAYRPLQEQLKQEFGENVTLEYRHFPLGGFQYSELASRAVEAAAEQDMKQEMHEKVFDGQEVWTQGGAEEIFREYAEELGLDMEQYEEDLTSDEIRERIQQQKSEGERRMVRGTPTFFINGQRVQQNPQNYQQFRSIVEMHMYR